MKGWITADLKRVVEVVKKYGYLKVPDKRELVVEVENERDYDQLNQAFSAQFGDSLNLEKI